MVRSGVIVAGFEAVLVLGSLTGCTGAAGAARPRGFDESAYTSSNAYRLAHRDSFARASVLRRCLLLDDVESAVTTALKPTAMLIDRCVNDAGHGERITVLMRRNEPPHHIVITNSDVQNYWMDGLRILFIDEEDAEPIWQVMRQLSVDLLERMSAQPAERQDYNWFASIVVVWTPELNVRIDIDHDLTPGRISPEAARVHEILDRVSTMIHKLVVTGCEE